MVWGAALRSLHSRGSTSLLHLGCRRGKRGRLDRCGQFYHKNPVLPSGPPLPTLGRRRAGVRAPIESVFERGEHLPRSTVAVTSGVALRIRTIGCLLALFALGHLQVFGAVRAYLCACAPQVRSVAEVLCHGAECHPGHNHDDGCVPDEAENSGAHSHPHLTVHDGSSDGTVPLPHLRLAIPALSVCWSVEPAERGVPTVPGSPTDSAVPESPPVSVDVVRSTVWLI